MVTDLRTVSKAVQPIGPVPFGIPLLSQLPKAWPLIVTDLKYCFVTIPFKEKDRKNCLHSAYL